MDINKNIIRKSEISAAMLKVFGYVAKVYPDDDKKFQNPRVELSDKWSDEIFEKAAEYIREGLDLRIQPNLVEMTMEMIVCDERINWVTMVAILSRPMTAVEAFEAAQAQRVLSD